LLGGTEFAGSASRFIIKELKVLSNLKITERNYSYYEDHFVMYTKDNMKVTKKVIQQEVI
jgi:hypothetical protein